MWNKLMASVGIAVLVGAATFLSPADAGQVGGGAHADGGGHVAYRAPAGTVVRVIARAVGGAHSLTSCAYQYGRWQATGGERYQGISCCRMAAIRLRTTSCLSGINRRQEGRHTDEDSNANAMIGR